MSKPPILSQLTLGVMFYLTSLIFLCGCAKSAEPHQDSQVVPAARWTPELKFKDIIANETCISPEVSINSWKFIVLHHSATESGSLESIDEIHRQRRDSSGRTWKGIGYHFVIGNGNGMKDGELRATFRWDDQLSGAHAGIRSYNDCGIGICLIGNFEKSGPTSAQMKTAIQLVAHLKDEFGILPEQVVKHGDLKATACPGRLFPIKKIAQSSDSGSQSERDITKRRFSSKKSTHTEGVRNVVSTQRFRPRSRQESAGSNDADEK